MALVTIALPVFNGEKLIGESLRCLQNQSLKDIEVIVLDNASTDKTAEIVETFAQTDPRFKLIRQPFNKGAVQNFVDGINAATGEFFAWRADDDLSDAKYFEILYSELMGSPAAALAVGTVKSMNIDGGRQRIRALPKLSGNRVLDLPNLLFGGHAAWFYGLWRRPMLLPVFQKVIEMFPEPWCCDNLTLFPFLIGRNVRFCEAAIFYQRFKKSSDAPRNKKLIASSEMMRMRAEFGRGCRAFFHSNQSVVGVEKLELLALLPFYINKRTFRISLVVRSLLSEGRQKLLPK